MSKELKPCPFCGEKATISKRYHDAVKQEVYYVYCIKCGMQSGWSETEEKLRKTWNRRVNK